ELQRAAGVPANAGKFLEAREPRQDRRASEACEDTDIRRHDGMKSAGVIARSLLRGLGVPLVQGHLPAARAEAFTYRGAGYAGADHDSALRFRKRRSSGRAHVRRDEHLSL